MANLKHAGRAGGPVSRPGRCHSPEDQGGAVTGLRGSLGSWQPEPEAGHAIRGWPLLPAAAWRGWEAWFRPLTSSIMSISPEVGQPPPVRMGDPRAQKAGQSPSPLAGFGCSIDAVISSSPPGGAWKSSRVLSIRADVHVPPLLMAFSTR